MLADGELDGIVTARAPDCFKKGAANVGRLFADYRAAEEAYFRKTKMFPIMHLLAIRRSLVEQHRWLPASVDQGFLPGQTDRHGRDERTCRAVDDAAVAGGRLQARAKRDGPGRLAVRRARYAGSWRQCCATPSNRVCRSGRSRSRNCSHPARCTDSRARTDYSALMPANLITLAHFSVSAAISLPRSAGEPAAASWRRGRPSVP